MIKYTQQHFYLQGAGYSSLVIISPFLAFGGIILCCLACTIFCISEVDEHAGMADFDSAVNQAANSGAGYGSTDAVPPTTYTPPPPVQQSTNAGETDETDSNPPVATWDPERGQVWEGESPQNNETNTVLDPKDESSDNIQPIVKESAEEANPVATSDSYDLD